MAEGDTLIDGEGIPTQTFDYSHEAFGKVGEDGRPEGVPEKFWQPGEDDKPGSIKIGELLHQHNHLDGKLGSFEGAPKDGYVKPELEIPDGVEWELADDDPLLAGFMELAGKHNISQGLFDEVVKFYVEKQLEGLQGAEQEAEAARAKELELLGEHATHRLNTLTQWFKNRLPDSMSAADKEALFNGFKSMTTSAAAVQALEFIAKQARTSPLPTSQDGMTATGLTKEQITEEMNKLDPNDKSKRLYDTNAEHRVKVTKMFEEFYGTEPASEEVSLSAS